jgi:TPR repeat protein
VRGKENSLLKQEKYRPEPAELHSTDHVWADGVEEGTSHPTEARPFGHLEAIKSRALGGDTEAQRLLALILELGLADEPDQTGASEWYMRAALRGLVAAQFQLARLYIEGRGVPRDYVSAYVWMAVASKGGHQTARTLLPLLLRLLNKKQLLEATERVSALRIPEDHIQHP